MITAIILAGGIGSRIGASIPKQFIEVNGKPILAYTLEAFQTHPMIDRIIVVSVTGWESVVMSYSQAFGISKLSSVIAGGLSAIDSISKGVNSIKSDEKDIIVIHDGVRPLVEKRMITDAIETARIHGAAMSAIPLKEHVFVLDNSGSASSYLPRENGIRSSTPQAFQSHILLNAFRKNHNTAYSSTLMIDIGQSIYPSYGSEKNFKITTKEDIELFKALLQIDSMDEKED